MNLLTDSWIPIQQAGVQEKITLEQLLCGEKEGDLCLPRDDMELACLQLLTAMTQVLFTPADKKGLAERINKPLSNEVFREVSQARLNWFDLVHPETPFMQFRGVKSTEPTGMEKLLAGVADGTNKAFVNPQGLGAGLCGGCVAIALFNTAHNCPSMGGGFKASLRGSTPITLLIKGATLRETLWLNVLTEDSLQIEMPWYQDTRNHAPNYVDVIKREEKIHASQIGLTKGLLWQPAHFELMPPTTHAICSCCGKTDDLYTGFNKEKFNYTLEGVWPYPLSARMYVTKKDEKEEKFPSFTTSQPTWVHLAKLVVDIDKGKEGYQAAPVVRQLKSFGQNKLNFIVGGYRNNQATILERRHEFFSLGDGWQENGRVIDELIERAQAYKSALRKALYVFAMGVKDKFAGSGVNLTEQYDANYYQQTETLIHDALSSIDLKSPQVQQELLYSNLHRLVLRLFEQATSPYQQEPKMLKALAASRRFLNKYLKELQSLKGGNHE